MAYLVEITGKKNKLHPEKKGRGESSRSCGFRSLVQKLEKISYKFTIV